MLRTKTKAPLARTAWLFVRIANVTFGGGDPTMAALERELVHRNRWLEPGEYGLAYSLARVTPGTNMIAFCVAAGWYLHGWAGGIAAALAVTVPCAVLAVWLTWAYELVKANPLAMAAVSGTLAAAAGMMLAAAWHLLRPYATRTGWLRALVLAGGSAAASACFGISPVAVLAAAAIAGCLWTSAEP